MYKKGFIAKLRLFYASSFSPELKKQVTYQR